MLRWAPIELTRTLIRLPNPNIEHKQFEPLQIVLTLNLLGQKYHGLKHMYLYVVCQKDVIFHFTFFFVFFLNIGQARFVKKISNFATLLHNALIIDVLIFWAGFFYKISTTFSAKDTKYGPYHLKQHKWRVCIF